MIFTKNIELPFDQYAHVIVTDYETPTAQFRVEFSGLVDNVLSTQVDLLSETSTNECAIILIPLLFNPDSKGVFFFEVYEDRTDVPHAEH